MELKLQSIGYISGKFLNIWKLNQRLLNISGSKTEVKMAFSKSFEVNENENRSKFMVSKLKLFLERNL